MSLPPAFWYSVATTCRKGPREAIYKEACQQALPRATLLEPGFCSYYVCIVHNYVRVDPGIFEGGAMAWEERKFMW